MWGSDTAWNTPRRRSSRESENPIRNTRGFPFIENALNKYAMPLGGGGGGGAMNVLSWRR